MQGFVILLALYVGVDKHQILCYNQCQTPYLVSDAPEYPHILCIKTCTNCTILYQNISNFGEKYMFFVMYLYRGYLVQGIRCIPPNICKTIQADITFGGFRSVFVILYRVNTIGNTSSDTCEVGEKYLVFVMFIWGIFCCVRNHISGKNIGGFVKDVWELSTELSTGCAEK